MHFYHLVLLLAVTFSVTCEGLAYVENPASIAPDDDRFEKKQLLATPDNDDASQRNLRTDRASTAVEDDSADAEEEERASVKTAFAILKSVFKKNPELARTLEKVESAKLTKKEAAAVQSFVTEHPEKVSRLDSETKELLLQLFFGGLISVIVLPIILAGTVFKRKD